MYTTDFTYWQDHAKKLIVHILGEHVMRSPQERALRCFEELCEACQAIDVPRRLLEQQLENTYSRPKEDNVADELGGTAFTLLALAASLNIDLGEQFISNFNKCCKPETQARMRSRQAEKLHPEGFVP